VATPGASGNKKTVGEVKSGNTSPYTREATSEPKTMSRTVATITNNRFLSEKSIILLSMILKI